jgi:N-acetylmuramoyl-L-alanine amidase
MSHPFRIAILLAAAAVALVGVSDNAPAQTPVAPPSDSRGAKCDRAKFRPILDVGHTVEDGGAISARGVMEYEFNLRLAREIEQKLIAAGFVKTAVLVTGGQSIPALVRRVAAANKMAADLFLSIHHDSVPDRFLENWEYEGKPLHFSDRFKGHSIFVSYENSRRQQSLVFAKLLGQQLKVRGLVYTPHYAEAFMGDRRRELLDKDVGVYRFDKLYVLRASEMPAVLLEAGSIINRDEELLLNDEAHRALIVAAVGEAIENYCATRPSRISAPLAHSVDGAAR